MSDDYSDISSNSQANESESEDGLTLPNPILHDELSAYVQMLNEFASENPTPPVFLAPLNVTAGITYIQTSAPIALMGPGSALVPVLAAAHLDNLATYLHCVTWADFFRDVSAYLRQS